MSSLVRPFSLELISSIALHFRALLADISVGVKFFWINFRVCANSVD